LAHSVRHDERTAAWRVHLNRGVREGALIVFLAVAAYLVLSLATYSPNDPGWSHSGHFHQTVNRGGLAGAWIADLGLYLFGYLAYLFPVVIAYWGWLLFRGAGGTPHPLHWLGRTTGFLLTLGAGTALATLHFRGPGVLPLDAGGILGNVIGESLVDIFSSLGATLFLLALFLTGITLFTTLSWVRLMDATGRCTLWLLGRVRQGLVALREQRRARAGRREREAHVAAERVRKHRRPRIEPTFSKIEPSLRAEKERQVPLFDPPTTGTAIPPLSLLDSPRPVQRSLSAEALEALSRQVEHKLSDFGIEVEVVAVHPGPVITRFELQPAPGVKVSRISNLAKDLARSLSTVSVRIVEVIPGKSVIGLEIPNEERELVCLGELLKSAEYADNPSPLSLALGKDIGGHPVVVDLGRMPHLLVAGTTGSGKSVAINAMVLSLLYKARPEDVRLIMIDPKMLELSVYEGIPHLLAPVVTDMKEAAHALAWCVAEMERRYQVMSVLGVRHIGSYNRKVRDAAERGRPIEDPLHTPAGEGEAPRSLEPLPLIVVIIDELADLMMVVGKKVEELIARLAQKARASGIHLIMATQRPSVDVITGLIKANIPARIAFQVSARVDSRTILDQMGAEQLLGHGDMLFLFPGMATPTRIHGAFVADHEVHKVVQCLKRTGDPVYDRQVLEGSQPGLAPVGTGSGTDWDAGRVATDAEADPLYDQAVHIVVESRRASISGVQRRLKIGYNRAARMIEHMEEAGIVGPLQSNGSREVLVPPPPEA
jgi:S-DNA-T family DNA segregation ATPase FtsK/SpoIIIE